MEYYPDRLYIRSGRRTLLDGSGPDYPEEALKHTYSRHMTLLFNIFFMLAFGKLFHGRDVRDNLNLFLNISKNPIFIVIAFVILGIQELFVTFSSKAG